jgi:toxin CptA
MRSAPAIGFEYQPSRLLAMAAAALSAVAVLAIFMSGFPSTAKIALALLACGCGGYALRRHLRPRVRRLNWRSDGGVSIELSDHGSGAELHGALHHARIFGPLIALQLRWPGGAASLWLLPDNLDADTRRRLRVRLGLDGARASVNADSV